MNTNAIAADQLKCVRLLGQILTDGSLTMPSSWTVHTFPGFDPPLIPHLGGFFHELPAPSVPELHGLLDAYADRFGLTVTEKPHGGRGLVGVHATGVVDGVELHVWGPATPEEDGS